MRALPSLLGVLVLLTATEARAQFCFSLARPPARTSQVAIPANTPALYFNLEATTQPPPEVGLRDLAGGEVPFATEPYEPRGVPPRGFLARPLQPFIEGHQYELYAGSARSCERDSVTFEATASAPLPVSSGRLSAAERLDAPVGARQRTIHLDVTEADWAFHTTGLVRVEVDGKQVDSASQDLVASNPERRVEENGALLNRLTLLHVSDDCRPTGSAAATPSLMLASGPHRVKAYLEVVGAETQPGHAWLDVEVVCPRSGEGIGEEHAHVSESNCTLSPVRASAPAAPFVALLLGSLLLRRRVRHEAVALGQDP